ncbi:MAG TPA: hypothetical protein VL426_01885 [Candidatus Binatia bacterium]|jgi:hypothetical protein|nr:hypothetical protein [Candidatus Binatia bacterium]
MGEAERQLPPPLPKKRKPKLIEGAVGDSPSSDDEILELADEDIIPVEDAEELFEVDVDLTELSPEEIAKAETREKERKERQPLLDALAERGLSTESSLEVIAAYDPEMLKDKEFKGELEDVARSYGVRFERMGKAEQEKLAVMYLGMKNGRIEENKADIAEKLENGVMVQLVNQAFADIGAVKEGLEAAKADPEKLKGNLREAMATLGALSKRLPFDKPENEGIWTDIYNRFNEFRLEKKGSKGAGDVEKAFQDIFEEFSGFIEDDVVAYRMKHSPGASIEHVTADTYGRTKEEMEMLKRRNREAVVEAMKKMNEGPGVELKMLEELHLLNNKGIVPRQFSKMRENPDAVVTFGKRLGILGDDVKPLVGEMLDRANDLIDRDAVRGVSKLRYEIEAAQLHNDLLDMHPFGDRNGSTSLLFLELMMMRKGYEPSKEREPNYYKHLSRVVGYNPIAVAVVGHEQYKISKQEGYYEGKGMTDEKKQRYDKIMKMMAEFKKRQQKK